MNLEKLIELIFSNPDNICIEYSNINGQETLKVNGEELNESFDDTKVIAEVDKFKKIIDSLPDCIFEEIIEEIEDMFDLNTFNNLIQQERFTEFEAEHVTGLINQTYTVIREKVLDRIEELENILSQI